MIPTFLETVAKLNNGELDASSHESNTNASSTTNVNEASYRAKTIMPLLQKLGKLFGKQFGSPFVVLSPEKFKRSDGVKGIGYRLVNGLGHQLRINFKGVESAVSDEFSRDAMYINGIDYWDENNTNLGRATLNVSFSSDVNILQIYNRLLRLIKAGKKGTYGLSDLSNMRESAEEENVDESNKPTKKDRTAYLKSKGVKATNAFRMNKRDFEQYIQDNSLAEDWRAYIDIGAPEKNTKMQELQKADKQLEDQQYSDPDTVFQDIEDLVNVLAKADTVKSLIICGQAGVGKTHHVTKTLKAFGTSGKDYVYHSAMSVTPNSFFSTIALERDKIICFDEADAILKDKDIQTMLKPLLDTSGDHRAEWSVQTAPMALHSEAEIRAYTENALNAAKAGKVELVYARKSTPFETKEEMYQPGGINKIFVAAAMDDEDTIIAKPTEYSKIIADTLQLERILPDSGVVEGRLRDELEKMEFTEEERDTLLDKVIENYQRFLDTPDVIPIQNGRNGKRKTSNDPDLPQCRWPSIVFFDGKMIFISNMRAKEIEPAVLSRSIFVDVYLRSTDIRNRIISIIKSDPSYDDCRDVMLSHLFNMTASETAQNQVESATYTNESLKRNNKQLSIRYVKIAADMYRQGISNWEELASKYC